MAPLWTPADYNAVAVAAAARCRPGAPRVWPEVVLPNRDITNGDTLMKRWSRIVGRIRAASEADEPPKKRGRGRPPKYANGDVGRAARREAKTASKWSARASSPSELPQPQQPSQLEQQHQPQLAWRPVEDDYLARSCRKKILDSSAESVVSPTIFISPSRHLTITSSHHPITPSPHHPIIP